MKAMALSYLALSVLASIIGGMVCMKTRHIKSYADFGAGGSFALGAGLTFFMTAGPACLMEVLRS